MEKIYNTLSYDVEEININDWSFYISKNLKQVKPMISHRFYDVRYDYLIEKKVKNEEQDSYFTNLDR
jgi:hypothetical protein